MGQENFRLGHRSRVKNRFLNEGLDFFQPYEAAELLLFYPIPQKDTKQMAHALIDRFGSLGAALNAEEGALCAIPGIGAHTADYLRSLLPFARYVLEEEALPASYADADALGRLFVSYFRDKREESVVAGLFNNRCELLRMVPVCSGGLCSPSLSVRDILGAAYAANASFLAIGCGKKGAVAFPSGEELAFTRQLLRIFENAGLHLNEVVLVAAEQYNPLLRYVKNTPPMPLQHGFCAGTPGKTRQAGEGDRAESCHRLAALLQYACKKEKAEALADKLLADYGTIGNLLFLSTEELISAGPLSEHAAILLRLAGAVYSYVETENARTLRGVCADAASLGRLFCGVHAFLRVERISLALLDANFRLIDLRFLANGSVNAAAFVPRLFVEAALRAHASYVAIAHNHPSGDTEPSGADCRSTEDISRAFAGTGVVFLEHFVVNERSYYPICYYKLPLCSGGSAAFYRTLPAEEER